MAQRDLFNHLEELDRFTLTLLECVQDATEVCLPIPGAGSGQLNSERRKVTPGWKEVVKPSKYYQVFLTHK